MSYCKEDGKDRIIFVTEEDHSKPSTITLPPDEEVEEPGLILDNGDINWNCPCLGGMASGPCGVPFREAFTCFHYSKEEMKGSDCVEQFRTMTECMSGYPDIYPESAPKEGEGDPLADVGDAPDFEALEEEARKAEGDGQGEEARKGEEEQKSDS